ncbi:MAG: TPM domain-containing protein [Porticoccaceae bacterium]|nr:TPM domain-containing protein [Porticoccaceae bacterium]
MAIIPSLAIHGGVNYSIEQNASELFNHWSIGWQNLNYSLLLLISKEDRKARIELGANWDREYDYQAKQVG